MPTNWIILVLAAAFFSAVKLHSADTEMKTVIIHLASDVKTTLTGDRGKDAKVNLKRASKFRMCRALSGTPGAISLELVGAKDFFVRHQSGVVKIHERPKNADGIFFNDASWKLIDLGTGKVRFEATNFPGTYICVAPDGLVLQKTDQDGVQSTFTLEVVK